VFTRDQVDAVIEECDRLGWEGEFDENGDPAYRHIGNGEYLFNGWVWEVDRRVTVSDWESANAMVDGHGDVNGEVHCKSCSLDEFHRWMWENDERSPMIGEYLQLAHRGGFVPAIVSSCVCELCGEEIGN
jgi:hypothetical protein